MPSWPVATPRAVSRHTKGRPCPGLVVTPISGRDPKEARPCPNIKKCVATPIFQTRSRHQNVCRDTELFGPCRAHTRTLSRTLLCERQAQPIATPFLGRDLGPKMGSSPCHSFALTKFHPHAVILILHSFILFFFF